MSSKDKDKDKAPKGPQDESIPVDLSLLSADDIAELRKQARASVLAEMQQDARDAFFARETKKLRQDKVPSEKQVRVLIDAAPYVPFFMLDGVRFYHGFTYEVRASQAAVLVEQMQRSWQHQDEIDGRGRSNLFRAPYNVRLGAQHAGTVTHGFSPGNSIVAEIGSNDRVTGA